MSRRRLPFTGWLRTSAILPVGSALGCGGAHSVVDPAGPLARSIAVHWWVMLALGTVVLVVVAALFVYAVTRAPLQRPANEPPARSADPRDVAARKVRAVGFGVAATVAILLVVTVHALVVSRATSSRHAEGALEIEVTGHQWWWDVRYLHPRADQQFNTANEIHIPVGEPVLIRVRSADVIHSFWVPNLQGKIDLIPGRENVLKIQADRPGEWKGLCAEFCGLQHAKMLFVLVARPRAEFDVWRAAQLLPAQPPLDSLALAGERIFNEAQCAFCHTVRGTPSGGRTGPDLTHLASRRTLGAGILPNTRGDLAGWILNPQALKPGNRMPPTPLDAPSMRALLAYLESLQ